MSSVCGKLAWVVSDTALLYRPARAMEAVGILLGGGWVAEGGSQELGTQVLSGVPVPHRVPEAGVWRPDVA